jgi:mRNA interferase MazF
MKRGEIWTLRDEGYAGKARPVIIGRSDPGEFFNSAIFCLFTTFESSRIPARVLITPSDENGLKKDSCVMTEKLITLIKRIGRKDRRFDDRKPEG